MTAKSRTTNRKVAGMGAASPRFRDLAVQIWPSTSSSVRPNARTHTTNRWLRLPPALSNSGGQPILVGADCVVIAGHARLAAARRLRMEEVPVIVLDHLSETQRRALILADNRLAMSGMDEEMLRVELESLKEDAFNSIWSLHDEEVEELLREPETTQDGLTDPDAVPAEQEAIVTVRGDVWVLDQHRLLCGTPRRWPNRKGPGAAGRHDVHRSAVQRRV